MAGSESTVLIVGASRGLGLALAQEFVSRDWRVIGTVRGSNHTQLHALADRAAGRVEIETLDIDRPDQIAALARSASRTHARYPVRQRRRHTQRPDAQIGDVDTDEFARVMTTNALSPMRVVEAMCALVPADGLVGVMSSGQGSITNNRNGVGDVYRASKAALNMLMRGFSARQPDRAAVLLAPAGFAPTSAGTRPRLRWRRARRSWSICCSPGAPKLGCTTATASARTVPW